MLQKEVVEEFMKRRDEKVKENDKLQADRLHLHMMTETQLEIGRHQSSVLQWKHASNKCLLERGECKQRNEENNDDFSKFSATQNELEKQIMWMSQCNSFEPSTDVMIEGKRRMLLTANAAEFQLIDLHSTLERSIREFETELDCLNSENIRLNSDRISNEAKIADYAAEQKRVTIPYSPNQREMTKMHLLKKHSAHIKAHTLDVENGRSAVLKTKKEPEDRALDVLLDFASTRENRDAIEVDIDTDKKRLSQISETKTRIMQANLYCFKIRLATTYRRTIERWGFSFLIKHVNGTANRNAYETRGQEIQKIGMKNYTIME